MDEVRAVLALGDGMELFLVHVLRRLRHRSNLKLGLACRRTRRACRCTFAAAPRLLASRCNGELSSDSLSESSCSKARTLMRRPVTTASSSAVRFPEPLQRDFYAHFSALLSALARAA